MKPIITVDLYFAPKLCHAWSLLKSTLKLAVCTDNMMLVRHYFVLGAETRWYFGRDNTLFAPGHFCFCACAPLGHHPNTLKTLSFWQFTEQTTFCITLCLTCLGGTCMKKHGPPPDVIWFGPRYTKAWWWWWWGTLRHLKYRHLKYCHGPQIVQQVLCVSQVSSLVNITRCMWCSTHG